MKLQELVIKEALYAGGDRWERLNKWLEDQLENHSMLHFFYHDTDKDELYFGEDTLNLKLEKPTEFPEQFVTHAVNGLLIVRGPLKSCENFPKGFRRISLGGALIKKLDIPLHDHKMNFSFVDCENLEDISILKDRKVDDLRIYDKTKLQVKDLPLWTRSLTLSSPNITSLKGIHEGGRKIGSILLGEHINSNILGLLLTDTSIDGVQFRSDKTNDRLEKAIEILQKYRGEGKRGVLEAQQEMIDNDLEDFAEL